MRVREANRSSKWIGRNAVPVYFLLAFAISWSAALAVVATRLLHHEPLRKIDGLMMFPAMLAGPPLASVIVIRMSEGRAGLRELSRRMRCVQFDARWWMAALFPPAMVLTALLTLKNTVSPAFSPGFYPLGVSFGLLAGLVEEIGWTGFALPRMTCGRHPVAGAGLLGLLWGLWHLPVIDFLGTASPHGRSWPEFAAAFIAAVAGLRVLIGLAYRATESVPMAQLMHAGSTAGLVVFSPVAVSPIEEAVWYAAYALLLWIAAAATAFLWRRIRARCNSGMA